ncbi:F0F1 ATP synthase subunit B [endosymbiont of unidentified scaly snail isolate Monju]|uniref:F0F1 ATP synthase subunit B n=1 Tax=endosymbiont of unidentified scaly snail isolate Monju TaxID=1248727 RepID=UPI00038927B6|nr:F0F1 ATP synthase subunit B [endosymbiont of unidentified scaly snail isolate Monju]BAN70226.1 F-type H+-transporting ATPase subunit b [endosymbiont of unidentified scaly snail isolate Monju]
MNINLTLIAQLVSFAVFVWFTMKFVWPPLVKAMDERKAKIADGLAAAERGQHEQEMARERAKEYLHEAKQQAAEITAKAEKQAALIVEEAKTKAQEEGARQLAAAQAEIEQEVNRAREELRSRVAELAVAGAEKILRREIDADAHKDIVEAVAKQI